MERSEELNELAAALAQVQGSLPAVVKSQTAKLKGETKAGKYYEYSYSYASLDAVWDSCRKLLSENNLAIIQIPDETEGHLQLETMLIHASGQWLTSTLPLIATPDPQKLGSQITYFRRYALSAMLGIVTDEDMDGQQTPSGQQAPQPSSRPSPSAPQAQQAQQSPAQQPQQAQRPSTAKPPPKDDKAPSTPADKTDLSQETAAFLTECGSLFDALPAEQQTRLLAKYGQAPRLDQVIPILRHHVLSEVLDLSAETHE